MLLVLAAILLILLTENCKTEEKKGLNIVHSALKTVNAIPNKTQFTLKVYLHDLRPIVPAKPYE